MTIGMSPEEALKMQNLWNTNAILTAVGARIELTDPDVLRIFIDEIKPHHRGGLGSDAINGGVISGLFDMAIGLVGIVNSNKHRTGTVQLNIHFLKPLRGNRLILEARRIKAGKSLVFARAEAFNEQHELCATCEGMCSVDFSHPIVENFMAI